MPCWSACWRRCSPPRSHAAWWPAHACTRTLAGITDMYETHLKKMNPDLAEIEYSISNLNRYIDSLPDLGVFMCVHGVGLFLVRSCAPRFSCCLPNFFPSPKPFMPPLATPLKMEGVKCVTGRRRRRGQDLHAHLGTPRTRSPPSCWCYAWLLLLQQSCMRAPA